MNVEVFPKVSPRIVARAFLMRAELHWKAGRDADYAEALRMANAWWMRQCNEGWNRIQGDLDLKPGTVKRFKAFEELAVPMEHHNEKWVLAKFAK